jgi:hypothetical protein
LRSSGRALHGGGVTTEGVVIVGNVVHDVLLGLSEEGEAAGDEDVEDDSQGPQVGALVVVVVVEEDVGGDVVGLRRGSLTVPTTLLLLRADSSSRISASQAKADPKSITFTSAPSFFRKSTFYGFRSRWHTR